MQVCVWKHLKRCQSRMVRLVQDDRKATVLYTHPELNSISEWTCRTYNGKEIAISQEHESDTKVGSDSSKTRHVRCFSAWHICIELLFYLKCVKNQRCRAVFEQKQALSPNNLSIVKVNLGDLYSYTYGVEKIKIGYFCHIALSLFALFYLTQRMSERKGEVQRYSHWLIVRVEFPPKHCSTKLICEWQHKHHTRFTIYLESLR